MKPEATRLARLLPDEVEGWRPESEGTVYGHDNLWDLIDGGAEVYRALNVRQVLNRDYSRQGGADIIVDLFDMGSPADAFGAFHFDMREQPEAGVGTESEYQGGSLFFWKHRYFVSIVGLASDDVTRKAVFALGARIAGAIPTTSPLPRLVKALPAAGVARAQLYYFHGHESLSRRLVLAGDNILGLGPKTEGLLLPFEVGGVLLLVRYPSQGAARAGLGALAGPGNEKARPKGAKTWSSRRSGWCAAVVQGRVLVAVLDATGKSEALKLLGTARAARAG